MMLTLTAQPMMLLFQNCLHTEHKLRMIQNAAFRNTFSLITTQLLHSVTTHKPTLSSLLKVYISQSDVYHEAIETHESKQNRYALLLGQVVESQLRDVGFLVGQVGVAVELVEGQTLEGESVTKNMN